MSFKLTEKDIKMLNGDFGPAVQMAMRIMTRFAAAIEAPELMDVTQAHIDGCGLLSEAGLEFAEKLVGLGGKVRIPTTLNMGPLDLQNWKRFDIDEDFAAKGLRQGKAYTDMGCIPTWSCAPYQSYLTPRFGQQIAWGESNAICYANSVLGARTNRYGDYMDICAALTGRVPRCGLHLQENRKGQILLRLTDIDSRMLQTSEFYVALGHLLGRLPQDKIPVIEGLPSDASSDQLKGLCAAAASSGAVALFHAVGVTPEAPTREDAFQDTQPEQIIEIGRSDLLQAWADLSTADEGDNLDAVVIGCPHFSYEEFRELTGLIQAVKTRGERRNQSVRFIVITCQTSYALLQRSDWQQTLHEFGIEITLDTCVFHTPMIANDARVIMTNSGKCAYYAPGELDVKVAFGSLADCVRSAIQGRVSREASLWKE